MESTISVIDCPGKVKGCDAEAPMVAGIASGARGDRGGGLRHNACQIGIAVLVDLRRRRRAGEVVDRERVGQWIRRSC